MLGNIFGYMRHVWTWNVFSPCTLIRLAIRCTKTSMVSFVRRRLLAGLDVEWNEEPVELDFAKTRRLMTTKPLQAASRRRFTWIVCVIFRSNFELGDNAPTTHSFKHVALLRPYYTLHLLPIFECWLNDIHFGQLFRVRRNVALFDNWHCVDTFGIPPFIC